MKTPQNSYSYLVVIDCCYGYQEIRIRLDGDDNDDFEEGGWLYLEKRSRERGDRRWKATLTEPADSKLKHATIFSTVISDH